MDDQQITKETFTRIPSLSPKQDDSSRYFSPGTHSPRRSSISTSSEFGDEG
ncbi:hypothetical protein [Wolbachia endosymbiont of Atemnus politus]|uniref:hypothetical protein n=1 Tax=Wolbachia endosymbiont of Atemnus politus TaxID=2682840 RepID=UPI001C555107|nr:hypothetical protein [Wolbachia endosymbiont of Atemnus politus]